jgi:hypothetical protein
MGTDRVVRHGVVFVRLKCRNNYNSCAIRKEEIAATGGRRYIGAMITKSEINKVLSLLGRCSYNEPNKEEFKRLSMKLLREVNKLGNFNAEIRFNKGGIAVSGDAILHSDHVYLHFTADHGFGSLAYNLYYRSCKGKKDYTGGRNNWFDILKLRVDGVVSLVRALQAVIPHEHICVQCDDTVTCNNPECEIPHKNTTPNCGAHNG